ncbi:MAG: tRNA preQ1(34) S-adenosylmethionine ribosyltransferase-isomerase QueA [Planctomycetes bacterium]|nr:tRNA preQ1(34) S-adenosylmethionine ribosyltransferase-isomerase QueA [Planctomycetota bacterium]
MRVSDFHFELPPEAIAAEPAEPRDSARLMVCGRRGEPAEHRLVRDLPALLRAGDLLVVNDTRVVPARLLGVRPTGGKAEVLVLEREGAFGRGFVKPAKKVRLGEAWILERRIEFVPLEALGGGQFRFELRVGAGDLDATIEELGRAPLPPYIPRSGEEDRELDRDRYQTVFAARDGAVAAPTAGLHFTSDLLASIRSRGVDIASVTLHVGEGTFASVRVDDVEDHRMHREWFELPEEAARAVERTRAAGGRVVAVGTTSARTLESRATDARTVEAGSGETELFLYPGKELRVVDALLTNFHLPESTLLMLVSAFAGRENVLRYYREAVERGYRFFSFGDAMWIA